MEILGIGAPELVFIVIIALIVLGPKDMQKTGMTIGRWLNKLIHSDGWFLMQKTSHELRDLPRNLMREVNQEMAHTEEDIRKGSNSQHFRSHALHGNSDPVLPDESTQSIHPSTIKKEAKPVAHPKSKKPTPKNKTAE